MLDLGLALGHAVMYKIADVEDQVRVPPTKFHMKVEDAIKSSLEERWAGIVEKELGVILSVVSIDHIGDGRILPGDGALYYPVKFQMLVYTPELHEVIKGHVIDVTEFGVFVRMGPVDGMIHVSQLMDDFVSYDKKSAMFRGRDTKRLVKEGDTIRARVISVSMESKQYKIGLTTRQFGLGVATWPKIVPRAPPPERPAQKAAKYEKPRHKG